MFEIKKGFKVELTFLSLALKNLDICNTESKLSEISILVSHPEEYIYCSNILRQAPMEVIGSFAIGLIGAKSGVICKYTAVFFSL